MMNADLNDLATFLAVARQLSFRRAAIERGVAPSAVSHAVRRLEERLALRLFHRTTRSVSLTDAGKRLFEKLSAGFNQIEQAVSGLDDLREAAIGTLRLTIPNSIAPFVLANVMGPIVRDHPGLHLDVVATDRLVDIVEEGYDAGIRFHERLGLDMIAVRIKPALRFAVIASPTYLDGRPLPLHPRDLTNHRCIRYRYPSGSIYHWDFERDGVELSVDVQGSITLDDQELMVQAALDGCGFAFVWEDRVRSHLSSGQLIRCLEDWCPPEPNLFLYYPSRRHVSAPLRVMIEHLRA